ncbi:serine/threonine-protein kinase [Streptomyces rimosus]|uniref:serine/threonine-protein kinase n=1 Tax=Streptomyces rimosus TaxID=1927 RepID=UPI0004C90F7F|nr:serine/threonine-protein kinase [Streptomyces rimosus]
MTQHGGHGGHADEPTSYGLRPPAQPAPDSPAPARDSYTPTRAAAPDAARPVPVDPDDPQLGRLLGGRYRLRSRLGHGGMGTVWTARDEIVDRDVAVKEPRVPDHLPERQKRTVYQRMQREARAAARIDHPSVVSVHDVVVEDGRPWIVMELVRGQSLGDRLKEGTLAPREAARIGLAVLGALTAAHDAGVLHRDVKPDNVLLGRHDRVVLTDFGIAQVEGEQGLTETGAFVGSPEFTAPERVLGQHPGPESDLWSLGVVLYAAVEGMSPFRRTNTPATLQAVLSAEPQTPARGSGALGAVIMQLLRKEPSARPGAAEVRQALESVARPPQPTAGQVRGYPTTGGSALVPPILQRNRKAQAGLGVGVLAVVVAVLLAFANPFAGDEIPEGWVVRPEGEVVRASLAVPDDYKRTVKSDESYVSFADPSGVFKVELALEHEEIGSLEDEAQGLVDHYKKGGENGTEMSGVHSSASASTQQDQAAMRIDTDYLPYSPSEDSIRSRRLQQLYVDRKKKSAWVLTVTMPAKGAAREDGDELFTNVVKFLRIQGL